MRSKSATHLRSRPPACAAWTMADQLPCAREPGSNNPNRAPRVARFGLFEPGSSQHAGRSATADAAQASGRERRRVADFECLGRRLETSAAATGGCGHKVYIGTVGRVAQGEPAAIEVPMRPGIANILLLAVALGSTSIAQPPQPEDLERTLWGHIRKQLTGPGADAYFNDSLKDALLPTLKGTLVVRDIETGQTLMLSMSNSEHPEVVLILKKDAAKYAGQLQPGAPVQFSAVALSFNRDPFYVVFEAEKAQQSVPALGL